MIKETEPMQEYLDNPAISSSKLKLMLQSPKDFKYGASKKETASQTKGTLWHTFMLERELYLKNHAIQPEDWGALNKNPGKKKWDEFKKQAKEDGKTPVKFDEAGELLALEREMEYHKALKKILGDFKAEVSFYGKFDDIELKSREDVWCEDSGAVWDVKTTSKNMDDESLEKVIFDNGYHFAAAHHMLVMDLAGYKPKSWGWIFVSTNTPCPHIVIKKASKELLEAGKQDWSYAFNMLKECMKKDSWPGYSDTIEEIGLPEWIERKYY